MVGEVEVRPRLERRNACSRIDYDPSHSLSSQMLLPSPAPSRNTHCNDMDMNGDIRVIGQGSERQMGDLAHHLGILDSPDAFSISRRSWDLHKIPLNTTPTHSPSPTVERVRDRQRHRPLSRPNLDSPSQPTASPNRPRSSRRSLDDATLLQQETVDSWSLSSTECRTMASDNSSSPHLADCTSHASLQKAPPTMWDCNSTIAPRFAIPTHSPNPSPSPSPTVERVRNHRHHRHHRPLSRPNLDSPSQSTASPNRPRSSWHSLNDATLLLQETVDSWSLSSTECCTMASNNSSPPHSADCTSLASLRKVPPTMQDCSSTVAPRNINNEMCDNVDELPESYAMDSHLLASQYQSKSVEYAFQKIEAKKCVFLETAKSIPIKLPPPPKMKLKASSYNGTTQDILDSLAPEEDMSLDQRSVAEGNRITQTSVQDKDRWDTQHMSVLGRPLYETTEMINRASNCYPDGFISDKSVSEPSNNSGIAWKSSDATINQNPQESNDMPRIKISCSSWRKLGLLGSGSFGTVYEAINSDGVFFAVKEVSLCAQGSKAKQCIAQIEQEISLLSQFQHENIVQYLGCQKDNDKLYIFLELVTKGSLASLYARYPFYNSQIKSYTRQILNGLKYLHEKKIVHRDIKCANILADIHGKVKLADFGLAKEISKFNELKSCKGSAYWMAPEVIDPRKTYWLPADIWSLGCTVLEMATAQPPFGDMDWNKALWKIGHGEVPPIPETLPEDAQNFIRKCLEVNPERRPTAVELLSHPFVRQSARGP